MDIHVRRMAIKHCRSEGHCAMAAARQQDDVWPISRTWMSKLQESQLIIHPSEAGAEAAMPRGIMTIECASCHSFLPNFLQQNRLPGFFHVIHDFRSRVSGGLFDVHGIPIVPLDQISECFIVGAGLEKPHRTIRNQHEELLTQCAKHLFRVVGIEL